jgi:hypothetical protein
MIGYQQIPTLSALNGQIWQQVILNEHLSYPEEGSAPDPLQNRCCKSFGKRNLTISFLDGRI